jgi:hypothetical protein
MKTLSNDDIVRLRKKFPPGTLVELVSMDDPYNDKLKPGARGKIVSINSIGDAEVDWDCGSKLSCIYSVDEYKRIDIEA